MAALLFAVFLALVPAPSELLARLDSPVWRIRENADRELRKRLHWPQAVMLELSPPRSPEARRRVERMLADYWHAGLPSIERMPHIDTLTNPDATGCRDALTRWYQNRGKARWALELLDDPCREYRLGCALFVEDLVALRVPPSIIRGLVHVMSERSAKFDRYQWRRMPDPLGP